MSASTIVIPHLFSQGHRRIVEPGRNLWLATSPAVTMAFVTGGDALVTAFDHRSCDDVALDLVTAGHLLGHEALLDVAGRTTTVRAVTRLSLTVVHIRDARDAIARDGRCAAELVDLLAKRVASRDRAAAAGRDPIVETRVVSWLVHLARDRDPGTGSAVVPLGQAELAQLCATRRPTLNRVLRGLAERGLVQVGRGRVIVRDIDALECGEPLTALAS